MIFKIEKELTSSGWRPDSMTNPNEVWLKINITTIVNLYNRFMKWYKTKNKEEQS